MLTQFKAYAWQIAAIALGVLLAVQSVRLANAQRDHARAVGVFNAAAATAERKAREQSETYRAKEKELRDAHDKIERETQATLAAATAGADRAVAAGQPASLRALGRGTTRLLARGCGAGRCA